MTVRWSAAPGTIVKVVVPDVSPPADAVIVSEPAVWAVTLFEATPDAAVAAPRPVTVPVPAVLANVTEVELSLVTTLSAASRTSAVSVRAAPDARLVVALVTFRWSAAPGTTVKVVVSEVRPAAEAVIVIEPAVWPVTESEATPLAAVAAPRPLTVPPPPVFANATEVELSVVTTLPAASRSSAVSVRAEPDARLVVELVTTTSAGAPRTTVNVLESEARPAAEAVIVIDPAAWPVTLFEATPDEAVAAPSPVTMPLPAVLAKLTEVALSPVRTLPDASRTSAVRLRAVAAVRFAVELVIVRWSAAPGTTVKVVVSEVRPAAEAVIVIEPAVWPVTLFEATPDEAVAAPSPVTVPLPAVLAKLTEVALSPVRTLPAASRTSAVSVRAAPEPRLAVELVIVRWSAAPGVTVKVVVSEVRPAVEAVIVSEPAVWAVTLFEATPDEAVAAPSPVTVPAPAVLAKVTEVVLSPVRTLPAASRTSAVSVRAVPEARLAVELVIVR